MDWNNAANWAGGSFPGGAFPNGNADIETTTPNIATLTTDSAFTPADIDIAIDSGATGRVDQLAGNLATGDGNWMYIGNTGTGAFNLANTMVAGGAFTGYGLGSGTLTIGGPSTSSGRLWIGVSPGGSGTFNMNTSGALSTQQSDLGLIVGTNGGQGIFNLDAGTVNINNGGAAWFGDNNASSGGTLNMSGGVFNASGDILLGHNAGSTGVLNMSGGVLNVSGNLGIGYPDVWNWLADAGTGVINLTGGTINTNLVKFSNSAAPSHLGVGSGTIGAGAVLNSKTYVVLAFGGNGSGGASSNLVVNGTLNVDTAGPSNDLIMGQYDTVNGNLTINPGATVRIENNANITFSWWGGNSGTQVINQTGGLVTFYSDSGSTVGGSGYLDMNLAGGSGSYTYNLNGGTLQIPRVGANSAAGTQTFNFNGGTLKATNSTTTLISNVGNVYVQSGGATIDDSSYSVTIPQGLLDSGGGAVTKIGAGDLTLSGYNTYTGGTTVNSGTLTLAAGGSSGTVLGTLNVNPGATVNLTAGDALGYVNGTSVTTVSVTGATVNNGTSAHNSYLTNYVLTGGSMTSTGGGPYDFSTGYGVTTNASNMTSVISAPLDIRDANNLTFNVAAGSTPNGVDLVVSGVIEDGRYGPTVNAITKTGAGLMILSGTNTYTGDTFVDEGTLIVASNAALPAGTSLTVGTGAMLIFDPTAAGSPIAGSPLAVTAVPEPGTLALLAAGLVVGVGLTWRKRKGTWKQKSGT